jgi:hypothetical protein
MKFPKKFVLVAVLAGATLQAGSAFAATPAADAARALENLRQRSERISWVRSARLIASERVVLVPGTSESPEMGKTTYVLMVTPRQELRAPMLWFQITVQDSDCGAVVECSANWAATLTGPSRVASTNVAQLGKAAAGASVTIRMNRMLSPIVSKLAVTSVDIGSGLADAFAEQASKSTHQNVDVPKAGDIRATLVSLLTGIEVAQ